MPPDKHTHLKPLDYVSIALMIIGASGAIYAAINIVKDFLAHIKPS